VWVCDEKIVVSKLNKQPKNNSTHKKQQLGSVSIRKASPVKKKATLHQSDLNFTLQTPDKTKNIVARIVENEA
jgi:hypothetical protein